MTFKKFVFFTSCFLIAIGQLNSQNNGLIYADSLYQTGNYSKAIEVYQSHPNKAEFNERIAKSYYALGNYGQALKHYDMALIDFPENALIRYDYAKLLSRTKKYDEAERQFEQLLEADNNNPNYHYEMGLVKEKQRDSLALSEFGKAYQLDPTHQKAIFKIAKNLIKIRKHPEAKKLIDIGLNSYAENIELLSLKAQNYYYADQYNQAIPAFNKLLEMGESSEFIHEKLSLSYAADSEYEKAIEQRKLALEFNPLNTQALFVIGTYYQRLQNFEKAEEFILRAIAIEDRPLDHEYQVLATILNRQKKHEQAIAMLNKSLQENPENLGSALYLVTTKDIYYKDRKVVLKLYEDLRDKHPDTWVASMASRRIKELKEEQFYATDD